MARLDSRTAGHRPRSSFLRARRPVLREVSGLHRDAARRPIAPVRNLGIGDSAGSGTAIRCRREHGDVLLPRCGSRIRLASDSPVRLRTFYDLDPGVTLKRLCRASRSNISGHPFFGTTTSSSATTGVRLRRTAGRARSAGSRAALRQRRPHVHAPAHSNPRFESDLSYLGTYAEDRQKALTDFFLEPARQLPDRRFCLGGALYPAEFPWTSNIFFVRHLPAAEHPEFYCSSRWTLNITRASMAYTGYCPSGRLFEAAACGTPVISDYFEGLEFFFEPGKEIVVVRTTEEAIAAIEMSDAERERIARAARERTLAEHTAAVRARELEMILASHSDAPRSSRSISPVEVS